MSEATIERRPELVVWPQPSPRESWWARVVGINDGSQAGGSAPPPNAGRQAR